MRRIFYFMLLFFILGCNKDDDGDDGGNPGGNNNCQWEKSSNKLELVNVSTGTECNGDPTSFAVTLTNVSEEKVRVAVCFEMNVQQGVGWSTQDHTLDAGQTKKMYVCEYSTGQYKYW